MTEQAPERFQPASMGGGLMEAEHRARYWWAAGLVKGRRTLDAGCGTGYGTAMLAEGEPARLVAVDLSEDAVAGARHVAGAEVQQADVQNLPFDDGEFDMVVCFEVIEHVEDHERALRELRRVLAPVGVLAVSSPNREVYPPGNPHHVHEYVPDELLAALEELFEHVRLYRQHPYLATALTAEESLNGHDLARASAAALAGSTEAGKETFTVALAGQEPLAAVEPTIVLADSFEVRWWEEQLRGARREALRLWSELETVRAELAFAGGRLLELEQGAGRLADAEAELQMKLRELAVSEATLNEVMSSPSWRLTAPLRAVKRLLLRGAS